MEYSSEKEFLDSYDSNKFEKLSMMADVLLISVSSQDQDNYRKTSRKMMSILLVKRRNYPFKDMWCLPGGFLNVKDETLEECARRVLKSDANVEDVYLEQLYTYDGINRDPRMRVVSTSYVALTDKSRLCADLGEAAWFDVVAYEEKDNVVYIKLDNGIDSVSFKIKKTLREKSTDRYSFSIVENNNLAFDNPLIILAGLERLKSKINYTDLVFNMMPEYFTLGELQQVYEVILNKKLLDPAFRRIIADKVEKTDKIKTGGGHRPSVLFRYKRR